MSSIFQFSSLLQAVVKNTGPKNLYDTISRLFLLSSDKSSENLIDGSFIEENDDIDLGDLI